MFGWVKRKVQLAIVKARGSKLIKSASRTRSNSRDENGKPGYRWSVARRNIPPAPRRAALYQARHPAGRRAFFTHLISEGAF